MGAEARYVAKADKGVGWRVWDRQLERWWGNYFSEYPDKVLAELNGAARPAVITELSRSSRPKRVMEGRRGRKP